MTKSNPRQKHERKTIKKRRNEKYNFIHLEDFESNRNCIEECGLQVASKQQYIRLKKKNFIQTHCENKTTDKTHFITQKEVAPLNLVLSEFQKNSPKSDANFTNDVNESPSMFSFHIQPDWSDFEDTDHIKFVSEHDFDLNILQVLDFETFEELSLPYGFTSNHLSNWATELSDERFGDTVISVNNIEKTIRNNYQFVFEVDHDISLWINILKEINDLLVVCESNKFLLHDLLMKDYSISIQEKCIKWTDLAKKCFTIKSSVEIIKDSEIVKSNFQIAIEILYDQCLLLLELEVIGYDPLVSRIIDGIKKISKVLRNQYNRMESNLKELFKHYEKSNVLILDQLDEEIKNMEKLSFANGKVSSLEPILEILGKYLSREKKLISVQKPVLNFCF